MGTPGPSARGPRGPVALVHSPDWSRFDYGPAHPLRMERLALTWRLMEAYALLDLPDATLHVPAPATESELASFHDGEYLDVLRAADDGTIPARVVCRYGLGPGDNPIFPGLWQAARLAAGGSLLAADLVARGAARRAFHFAGGLHHAMPARASGFCYINDVVLAIRRLTTRGWRVAYVDLDAHHGDGVQAAFYGDPGVLTISLHERGDRLFPGTGFVAEQGEGAGRGYAVNVPLDVGTDAEVWLEAFEAVVPALLRAFRPDVVVAQLGIDAHRTDPLTHLALDVQGFRAAVARLVELAPRLVALGGGGYELANVARAWTAAWAALNEIALADTLPMPVRGAATLTDTPVVVDPAVRARARDFARRQVDALRREVFPVHGL